MITGSNGGNVCLVLLLLESSQDIGRSFISFSSVIYCFKDVYTISITLNVG